MRVLYCVTTLVAVSAISAGAFLACDRGEQATKTDVRSHRQAIVASSSYELSLPQGLDPRQVTLGAFTEARVNDRVTVEGLLTSTGPETTNIGVDAVVGSVQSVGNVLLRNSASVEGDVFSEGTVTLSTGASVSGTVTQNTNLGPEEVLRLTVPFDFDAASDVLLQPDTSQTLAQGTYRAVSVGPRSTLHLSTGVYHFESLSVQADAVLSLNQSSGPVYIYVKSAVSFSGAISAGASGLHPQLLLVAGGTGEVSIHTAFQGAIFAPNGKINLATVNPPGHAGQFIADRIEVHQNQTITYVPFEGWNGVWDSPEPTESAGDDGDTGVVRLFGDTPAGNALKQLHLATATQTDPGVVAARFAAVKALPVADVVTELTNAASNAEDSSELWITLFLSATVEDAAIIPLFNSVLTEPVPEHYLSENFDSHDATFDARLSVLRRSTASLAHLVGAGITEAREPLLDVLAHPIRGVRRNAAYRIRKLEAVDPGIVDEMVDRLLPGDEEFSDIRDAEPSDFDLTPPTGISDDSPANGAGPGNSEGTTVNMPTCTDGLKNQTETAVDCGGGCDPCGNGQQCQQHSDCAGLNCNAGVCQAGDGTTSGTTTGGTTTSTTSGTGGTGGGGSCSETTAIDLGAPGNDVTVPNDACVRVSSGYPTWWDVRTMQLQTTAPGAYPVPFSWSNACAGSSGSGAFTQNWQNQFFGPTNEACATVIDLQGSGTGTVTIRYYAN